MRRASIDVYIPLVGSDRRREAVHRPFAILSLVLDILNTCTFCRSASKIGLKQTLCIADQCDGVAIAHFDIFGRRFKDHGFAYDTTLTLSARSSSRSLTDHIEESRQIDVA